jgi:hypothetical protein
LLLDNTASETLARISVLSGDAVHCLRSCLDHIVWELSTETGKASCEFPIFRKPGPGTDGFHGSGIQKCWTLPVEAKVIIERLQPYQRGKKADRDPLWAIHDLDRVDKHRRLVTSLIGLRSASFFIPPGFAADWFHIAKGRDLKDGDVIAYVPAPHAQAAKDFNPHISIHVALKERPLSDFETVGQQIGNLCDYVETEVIPEFAPFFT